MANKRNTVLEFGSKIFADDVPEPSSKPRTSSYQKNTQLHQATYVPSSRIFESPPYTQIRKRYEADELKKINVQSVSVWSKYSRGFEVDFGTGFLHLSWLKNAESVLIQQRESEDITQVVQTLTKLRCESFVSCLEVFKIPSEIHFVFEPMHMSLKQVTNAIRLPTEQELIAITGQLVQAVDVMSSHRVSHHFMSVSNAMINSIGVVKIFLDKNDGILSEERLSSQKYVQAVGDIIRELALIYDEDEDKGVLPTAAPAYSALLFEFLRDARQGHLVSLREHPFLAKAWSPRDLQELCYLTCMSSSFQIRYSQFEVLHSEIALTCRKLHMIKHRVDRSYQYAAINIERQLTEEKKRCFLGSAKIPVTALDLAHSSARELDTANVDRLLSIFELSGCSRLDARYHVPAMIDENLLRSLLRDANASLEDSRSDDPARWPTLKFPDGAQIECLHGQHRLVAAQRYLIAAEQWWVVDLYSTTISPQLRASLKEQTSNEVPLTAGEIYFQMLRCDPDDVETVNAWKAQIQTQNGLREVQQLFTRGDLNSAFRSLAQIPAFGPSMLSGNIHVMMRTKCDEEIRHYLSYVHKTWLHFLNSDEAAMQRLDRVSVEHLQGRSPANCARDRAFLEPLVERGDILRGFDLTERRGFWAKLLKHRRLIPSLFTFFEDLKYLRSLANCVTRLVHPLRKQTVRQALKRSFQDSLNSNGADARFNHAYRRLWLHVMCNLEDLRPGSTRLERLDRVQTQKKNLRVEHDLARAAHNLGFRSVQIDELLKDHPDHREARDVLLRARPPDSFAYPTTDFPTYVEQIGRLFTLAVPKNIHRDPPTLTVNGPGEKDLKRRSGRPYRLAFQDSAVYLTLENIALPDPSSVGGLSPFYIRRHVFLAFFGISRDDLSECERGSRPGAPLLIENIREQLGATPRDSQSQSPPQSADIMAHALISYSSPSVYSSREEQGLTASSPVQTRLSTIAHNVVRFIEQNSGEVLEEIPVIGVDTTLVTQTARHYRRRRCLLFNRDGRSVHPSDCAKEALAHPDHLIMVTYRDDAAVIRVTPTKRKASELVNPRKNPPPKPVTISDPALLTTSASIYSGDSSQYTDMSLYSEENAVTDTPIVIRFLGQDSIQLKRITVVDRDGSAVWDTAHRYRKKGFLLFSQGRSVHPSNCFQQALRGDRTISLVPRYQKKTKGYFRTKR